MARTIPLTRGYETIVDDDLYDFLASLKWHLNGGGPGRCLYARRVVQKNGHQTAIWMHRLIIGAADGDQVDHIDGDGLNNRKDNLRFCTTQQNGANRKINKTSTSGFKGVVWSNNNWVAKIGYREHYEYLGRFDDPAKAARVYDVAAIRKYGEFARTNFPRGV